MLLSSNKQGVDAPRSNHISPNAPLPAFWNIASVTAQPLALEWPLILGRSAHITAQQCRGQHLPLGQHMTLGQVRSNAPTNV